MSNSNIFPFEIQDLDPEVNKSLCESFECVEGLVRVGPKGYVLPKGYRENYDTLYNMEPRPDQVFVGGYPRSGTTWVQQLVWLIKNDLDYVECEKTFMEHKFKYLERNSKTMKIKNRNHDMASLVFHPCESADVTKQNYLYFKTHLPLSLLSPKFLETTKMVYVARDPRDAIVSFYYLNVAGFWHYKKDFRSMWNFFLKGTFVFCPYFEHVKEFWEKRHDPNLLFLFYEDLQNNRLHTVRSVANFFGKAYTEEQLIDLCNYLDFNNLKDKKSYNHARLKEIGIMKPDGAPFIRRGEIGTWREYFDEEMCRQADEWIADNLRGSDLCFPTIDLKRFTDNS